MIQKHLLKKQQDSQSIGLSVTDLESMEILLSNTPDCTSKAVEVVQA